MNPTRRGVLCAMGVAATAGCTEALGSLTGDDLHDMRAQTVTDISESVTLSKGQHKPYKLDFDTQTVLLYQVIATRDVDVIMFRRPADYEQYKTDSADELPYISELSELDTEVAANGSAVTAGEPVLVIDNTTWAKSQPVESVTVNVEIEAFVRPEHAAGGGSGG